MNSLRVVIEAWLNSPKNCRDGVGMNIHTRTKDAVLSLAICVNISFSPILTRVNYFHDCPIDIALSPLLPFNDNVSGSYHTSLKTRREGGD